VNLLDINDLSAANVSAILVFADTPVLHLSGTLAWSFEGSGICAGTTLMGQHGQLDLVKNTLNSN